MANSIANILGFYKDSGNSLTYRAGTESSGPDALWNGEQDPGSKFESLSIDHNGDNLTYMAGQGKNGYDNTLTYNIENGPGNTYNRESLTSNMTTGELTLTDNQNIWKTDKSGNITETDEKGQNSKEIGNIKDQNLAMELRRSGMTRQEADNFEVAGREGGVEALNAVKHDFTAKDRGLFDQMVQQANGTETPYEIGGSGTPSALAKVIEQVLGQDPTKGAQNITGW